MGLWYALAPHVSVGNIQADATIVFAHFLAVMGRRSEAVRLMAPTKAWLQKSGYKFLDAQLSEIDLLLGTPRESAPAASSPEGLPDSTGPGLMPL